MLPSPSAGCVEQSKGADGPGAQLRALPRHRAPRPLSKVCVKRLVAQAFLGMFFFFLAALLLVEISQLSRAETSSHSRISEPAHRCHHSTNHFLPGYWQPVPACD